VQDPRAEYRSAREGFIDMQRIEIGDEPAPSWRCVSVIVIALVNDSPTAIAS